MGETGGLEGLEKVVDAVVKSWDAGVLKSFCWAMGKTGGLEGLEKVVDAVVKSWDAGVLESFCRVIPGQVTWIPLLKKIEHCIMRTPEAIYDLACIYSRYRIWEKALYYLNLDLAYQQKQSIEKLKKHLNHISWDYCWDEMRGNTDFEFPWDDKLISPEFHSLIQKYEKIVQEKNIKFWLQNLY